MIDAYRLTDSLAVKAYCKVKHEIAGRWVEQDLARWCKDGEAIQLTGTIAQSSVAASAITHSECMANAAVAENDSHIAAAQRKVNAWPSVGSDPRYGKPTKAPLPTQPGGIKRISREELERLSSSTGPVVVEKEDRQVPDVLHLLRKNTMRGRLPNNDFVRQHYDDDEQWSLPAALPVDYHETDGIELER
jgi:hypothetical protein